LRVILAIADLRQTKDEENGPSAGGGPARLRSTRNWVTLPHHTARVKEKRGQNRLFGIPSAISYGEAAVLFQPARKKTEKKAPRAIEERGARRRKVRTFFQNTAHSRRLEILS
jgi:hypothetical protein